MGNQSRGMTWMEKMEKLGKWRSVFAGWQLGTRSNDDPECNAVRDHREVTMALRAEVNALIQLLVAKGVFTVEEYQGQLGQEAEILDQHYERKFPGMKTTRYGVEYDIAVAKETMKDWRK
jgi:hypothetical protein